MLFRSSLKLLVKDGGTNSGSYAQVVEVAGEAASGRPQVTEGGAVTSDLVSPMEVDEWVYIRATAGAGYVIKGAEAAPQGLGTYMEWDTTDPTLLKVKQPAGQVTVTVEFEPEGTRSNEVRLHINTIGSGNGTASVTNTNTSAVLNADGRSEERRVGKEC